MGNARMVTERTMARGKRAIALATAKPASVTATVRRAVGARWASASERIARDCICARLRLLNRVVSGIYDETLRPLGLELSQLSVLIAIDPLGERATGVRPPQDFQIPKASTSRG